MNNESTAIGALILIFILGFLAFVFIGNDNEQAEVASPETTPEEIRPEQSTLDAITLTNAGINDIITDEVDATATEEIEEEEKLNITNWPLEDLIMVFTPRPNQEISSPLVIEGRARGFWFFEADFPVMLTDSNGEIIARGLAQAKSDWMTEDFVPFSAELKFTPDYAKVGFLMLHNDNPSDLPENNREFNVPVLFKARETMIVQVFFSNAILDPDFTGNKVFPSERVIPKTQAVAKAAIEELLKGPNEQEKEDGFFTSINTGVKVQKLSVVDGVAQVDFNQRLEYQVGGSARVGAIRAEIIQTLMQFPTVEQVIISVNGRTEDILQP